MIKILKEFATDPRIAAGVSMGTSAALANAGVIKGWIPIVVAAAFTPFLKR